MDTNTHVSAVASVPLEVTALTDDELAGIGFRLANNPDTYVDPVVVLRLMHTCIKAREALHNIAEAGKEPTSLLLECVRDCALLGLGKEV
jgi:hypothetical protein